MNIEFEDFDTEEKIACLRSDLDQIMHQLDIRSDYVSKAEMAERIAKIEAGREARARRAEIIANLNFN